MIRRIYEDFNTDLATDWDIQSVRDLTYATITEVRFVKELLEYIENELIKREKENANEDLSKDACAELGKAIKTYKKELRKMSEELIDYKYGYFKHKD